MKEENGRDQRYEPCRRHRGDGTGQRTGLPTGGEEEAKVKYTRLLGDQNSY